MADKVEKISVDGMLDTGSEFAESRNFEELYWPFLDTELSPAAGTQPDNYSYNNGRFSIGESEPSSPENDPETPTFLARTCISPAEISSGAAFTKSSSAMADSPYVHGSIYEMTDVDMVTPESGLALPQNSEKHRKNRAHSSSSESGSSRKSSTSANKLRTASNKPKRASKKKNEASNVPPVSGQVLQARASHNLVERQYRNRLNKQFEQLLDILPTSRGEDDTESTFSADDSRRFSKAEVLVQARRRIQFLERERDLMMAERNRLHLSLAALQRR